MKNKPNVSIIVARSRNGVIGANNTIPWMGKLKEDMIYFLRTTYSHPVIMGRRTYQSLAGPLKGRQNVVLSQTPGYRLDSHPGWDKQKHRRITALRRNLKEAVRLASIKDKTDNPEIFILGGGQIYELALRLGLVDRVYITQIDAEFEGDTFFPDLDPNQWQLVSDWHWDTDDRNSYPFNWKVYERQT